jgi:hypothetical protein
MGILQFSFWPRQQFVEPVTRATRLERGLGLMNPEVSDDYFTHDNSAYNY